MLVKAIACLSHLSERMEGGAKKKKRMYAFQMKTSNMHWGGEKFHSQQAGRCWIITFAQPSSLIYANHHETAKEPCCWEPRAPSFPSPPRKRISSSHGQDIQKAWKQKQKAEKKARLAYEADSVKCTYNREHTDITSSTILRQEDKEKRDRQRN